ncbi:gliding motility lipoprotein GldH [Flagellimonas flava]|uniref:Gliding motility-associated lipoprotein GldH n=1 Tax=Flagellimonas flava TaxID=570519 RepID=A0A1M5Q1Z4_9FLAO|nr:gliding motility lipoprotein GldH [Allomuricauda flava]SHH07916.1 gliding motility-associated lipoprotein GldH [Allomuricauda flava]
MRNKICYALVFLLCMVSCNSNLVFSDYVPVGNGKWEIGKAMDFEFSQLDSVQNHHMFISIRNDNTFEFSNLFLITELEYPDGNTIKDTLEFKMAEPTGEWLGKGVGSIKENKLWYRENIVFPDSGVYKLRVAHAMRKNGEVDGLHILQGITDVGLEIEKSTQ